MSSKCLGRKLLSFVVNKLLKRHFCINLHSWQETTWVSKTKKYEGYELSFKGFCAFQILSWSQNFHAIEISTSTCPCWESSREEAWGERIQITTVSRNVVTLGEFLKVNSPFIFSQRDAGIATIAWGCLTLLQSFVGKAWWQIGPLICLYTNLVWRKRRKSSTVGELW